MSSGPSQDVWNQLPATALRLGDEHWEVRENAARELGEFGLAVTTVIPQLTRNLDDANERVRVAASEVLGRLSKSQYWSQQWEHPEAPEMRVLPELTLRQSDMHYGVRKTASEAIGMLLTTGSFGDLRSLTSAAIPELIERLNDENWACREAAATTLSDLSRAAVPAVGDLVRRLADSSYAVRTAARLALAQLRSDGAIMDQSALGSRAVPILTRDLESEDWRTRVSAAWALGGSAGTVVVGLPHIVKELQDEMWSVRFLAIEALGNLGATAAPAVPELAERLLDDPDGGVRDAAKEALNKFAASLESDRIAPSMHRRLVDGLHEEDIELRDEATLALGSLGVMVTPSVPEIVRCLLAEQSYVRESAKNVILRLFEKGAFGRLAESDAAPVVPALSRLLKDDIWAVRLAAAEALGLLAVVASRAFLGLTRWAARTDDESYACSTSAKRILRRLKQAEIFTEVQELACLAAPELFRASVCEDKALSETAQEILTRMHEAGLELDVVELERGLWGEPSEDKGDPYTLEAFAVGERYEVKSAVIVRVGEVLDSKEVMNLKAGAAVTVLEKGTYDLRRVRVLAEREKCEGWLSLATSDGEFLVGPFGIDPP
eukprot:TRINITY_DN15840_c0_g1_i1.p1 TRINITY_DN15840_c0_g1~~TRINITY_DN15840_c0_g1_i1.p1  ORF type:complete len:607 (+),score=86.91 TRINITY_DN15840_c0_g1_i1:184-2004(+)